MPPSRPIPSTIVHYRILGKIWIKPIRHRLVSIGLRYGQSVNSHVQAALHLWLVRQQSIRRIESLHCTSSLYCYQSLVGIILTRCFNSHMRRTLGYSAGTLVLVVPMKYYAYHDKATLHIFFLASLPRLPSDMHACTRSCSRIESSVPSKPDYVKQGYLGMLRIQLSRSITPHRYRPQSILRLVPLYQVAMIPGYSFQDWICCPRNS